MAVPKKKTSKSKTRSRRASAWQLNAPARSLCPRCGNAKTPHRFALGIIPMGRQSTAYGYSQALDGTWEEYEQETRNRGARRDRIADATDFMGWYMDGSTKGLGISKWDARSQYLAYHEGRTGFAKGSYNAKSWLVDVADKVQRRSDRYASQLASCGRD